MYKISQPQIQYTDYIMWQKEKLSKEILFNQMSYWKKKLGGTLPVLNLKTDKKRPELVTYKGGIIQFTLDTETTEKLRQLGKRYRSTLYMVLLAIYKTVLYRYTGQEDIIIGSPIAGRGHPQIENIIGCFVNTLVMRTQLNGDMEFGKFLEEVRTTSLEAFSNSNIPFDSLVSELNPKRDITRSPVFQAMMTMQDKPCNLMDLPALSVSDAGVINDLAPYDLSVIIWVEKNETTFYVEYYADIFEEETISKLMEHYTNILYSVLDNPQQKLKDIPMLSKDEEEYLISRWNIGTNALKMDKALKDAVCNQAIEYGVDVEKVKIFVLDNNYKPVPPRSMGKLYFAIKGDRNETCVDNLYDDGINNILYCTGKDVYHMNDNIVYMDEAIKIEEPEKDEKVYLQPRNEIEKTLVKIWSDVLKRDQISTMDSFFDIGGNSMLLVEVASKISQHLSKELQVMDLFKYPTISSLAGFLNKEKEDKPQLNNGNQRAQKQMEAMNRMNLLRKNKKN